MRRAALIVVNYFSAALASDAIRSARAASVEPLEVIVVDNSCDEAEAERVSRLDAERTIISSTNSGYAAAINAGVRASEAEIVIASNPDVVFRSHTLDLLKARLIGSVALTGPRFVWDDDATWLLPPADDLGCISKFDEIASTRSSAWRTSWLRRRFKRRVSFWQTDAPMKMQVVSGAVMCISRAAFDSVGGFDETFPLYFEEIDFMRRLRKRGFTIEHVAPAECRHLYSQSARLRPDRAAVYARSEQLYLKKWCRQAGALSRFASSIEIAAGAFLLLEPDQSIAVDPATDVIEVSPLRDFSSAAGSFPKTTRAALSATLLSTVEGEPLYLRVVNRHSGEAKSQYVLAPGR